jgi:hypothetical protein
MNAKPITLTPKQVRALERAWEVLGSGYASDRYNGGDFAKRHNARDRAAARVIDQLLEQAGIGYDGDECPRCHYSTLGFSDHGICSNCENFVASA